VLVHSQAGPFGWKMLDSYPDLVKAVVAIEPYGPPFSRKDMVHPVALNYGLSEFPLHFEPTVSSPADFDLELLPAPSEGLRDGWIMNKPYTLPRFQNKPILLITAEASIHTPYDHLTSYFLKQASAKHDFVRLEERGIRGNGHMMILEKNNLELASLICNWLNDSSL
jgi:pimeloyl-ACP methyl ester carboxylesterase